MFLKHIRDIAKPQHFAIIDTLKRSTGMPVAELSRALDMSYMGVKQHCLDLEKKGWLDTWRRPVPNGRPEKLYRVTAKGSSLFPEAGTEMLLELMKSLSEIFGTSAPEKLLFSYFQKKAAALEKKLKGKTPAERASHLARLRSADGHCSEIAFSPEQGLHLVEWHNPHQAIAAAYPSFHRHEEQMLQRLLGTAVLREEQKSSGLSRIVFRLPAISAAESESFLQSPEAAHVKAPAPAEETAVPCPPDTAAPPEPAPQLEAASSTEPALPPASEAPEETVVAEVSRPAIPMPEAGLSHDEPAAASASEAPEEFVAAGFSLPAIPAPDANHEPEEEPVESAPAVSVSPGPEPAPAAPAALPAPPSAAGPDLTRRAVKPVREECARLEELPLFTRYSVQQELAEEVLSN